MKNTCEKCKESCKTKKCFIECQMNLSDKDKKLLPWNKYTYCFNFDIYVLKNNSCSSFMKGK